MAGDGAGGSASPLLARMMSTPQSLLQSLLRRMLSPPLSLLERIRLALPSRMRLALLALLSLILFFATSFSSIVLLWLLHALRTPSTHTLPVALAPTRDRQRLTASLPLTPPSAVRVRLSLLLPESTQNLAHSVFRVRASLDPCRGAATAVLAYRSPALRAIRAVVLALPLLTGLADEYQRVALTLVECALPAGGGGNLRISVDAPVQVAAATVRVEPATGAFWRAVLADRGRTVIVLSSLLWVASVAAGVVACWVSRRVANLVLPPLWAWWRGTPAEPESIESTLMQSEPSALSALSKSRSWARRRPPSRTRPVHLLEVADERAPSAELAEEAMSFVSLMSSSNGAARLPDQSGLRRRGLSPPFVADDSRVTEDPR